MPVFKYLPPERFDVLRDARIRFTQANALNDPFEFKPFFKTIFNMKTFKEKMLGGIDLRKSLLEQYSTMPRKVRRQFTREEFVRAALGEMDRRKDEAEATL